MKIAKIFLLTSSSGKREREGEEGKGESNAIFCLDKDSVRPDMILWPVVEDQTLDMFFTEYLKKNK